MTNPAGADWVIVVDDDLSNLKIAGFILSQKGIRVTALQNGAMLTEQITSEKVPDAILLDILMPGKNGFETLSELRQFEKENNVPEIPVVFLTATEDKELEAKGFAMGAVDFIRKPFEPEVLIHRIKNILGNSKKIQDLSEEAVTDALTGLLNKGGVTTKLEKICAFSTGALLILDLDNFKLVNDIYGHDAGDKILVGFAELLRRHFRTNDIIGRIGGDEFIAFLQNSTELDSIRGITSRLQTKLHDMALDTLGKNLTIPFGMSVGAVVTNGGVSYQDLFTKADKSLYYVKENGKHGCYIYSEQEKIIDFAGRKCDNLRKLNIILNERKADESALFLGQDTFISIYRYLIRFLRRYHENAYKILFTVTPKKQQVPETRFNNAMAKIGDMLKSTLRNCDIITQCSVNQFFLLLPMVDEETIDIVITRIYDSIKSKGYDKKMEINYEKEAIINSDDG